jgi:hypothetical protein
MMKKAPFSFAFSVSLLAILAYAPHARSQVTVDGVVDPAYGSAIATQTVNSGFGNSTSGDGTSSGGSELDAAYGIVQSGTFYLMLTGNVENNGNRINIFLDAGQAGGQNTLQANTSTGTLDNMNGSVFSPGFNADYALDINDYSGTLYVDQYDLDTGTAGSGSLALTGGTGSSQNLLGMAVGFNNTNTGGVNGNSPTAASSSAADSVTTGLELAIPLSLLGNPTGSIEVLADINGGDPEDTYLSNQFLPGLPVGTGNIGAGGTPYTSGSGTGAFNLASTPGEYFTVAIPEPAMCGLLVCGAGILLLRKRNRTLR